MNIPRNLISGKSRKRQNISYTRKIMIIYKKFASGVKINIHKTDNIIKSYQEGELWGENPRLGPWHDVQYMSQNKSAKEIILIYIKIEI